jgi:hypothetical protein
LKIVPAGVTSRSLILLRPLNNVPSVLLLVRFTLIISLPFCCSHSVFAGAWQTDGFHVFQGDSIQTALDNVALNPTNKTIKVHAGVYRPEARRQALIWFNRTHDGIRLEAVGDVTLTAANPELSEPGSSSYPAVVNHVVYFGDGISERTTLQGFRITGANHFVTTEPPEVESSGAFKRDLFFYSDGGAVKIFGHSYPTLRQLEIVDNYASPCAGGISVQHQGHGNESGARAVKIENCLFLRNRSQITGAAFDLLPGSSAVISNCLFVGNIANLGANYISANTAQPEFTNSAPLTVFPGSRAIVQRCTFTNNRNGVEDLGGNSRYENCIFWANALDGAFYAGKRYELNIQDRAQVSGCIFGGPVLASEGIISNSDNQLNGPDPKFDTQFRPASSLYKEVGFRPGKPTLDVNYSPKKAR